MFVERELFIPRRATLHNIKWATRSRWGDFRLRNPSRKLQLHLRRWYDQPNNIYCGFPDICDEIKRNLFWFYRVNFFHLSKENHAKTKFILTIDDDEGRWMNRKVKKKSYLRMLMMKIRRKNFGKTFKNVELEQKTWSKNKIKLNYFSNSKILNSVLTFHPDYPLLLLLPFPLRSPFPFRLATLISIFTAAHSISCRWLRCDVCVLPWT